MSVSDTTSESSGESEVELDLPAGFSEALDERRTSRAAADAGEEDDDDSENRGDPNDESSNPTPKKPADEPHDESIENAWLTPEILSIAELHEISAEEAAEFGSLKSLTAAIRMAERNKKPGEKKTADPPPKEEELKAFDWRDGFKSEELEDLSESIVGTFDKIQAALKTRDDKIAALEKKVGPVETIYTRMVDEEQKRTTAWFDDEISKLGLDSLLGKGTASQIRSDAKSFANRQRIWGAFTDLMQKNPKADPAAVLKKAARVEFLDEIEKLNEQQRVNGVREQSGRRLGKPSGKAAPAQKPRATYGRKSDDRQLISKIDAIIARRG